MVTVMVPVARDGAEHGPDHIRVTLPVKLGVQH
jgi:hypothetical protein